MRNRLYSVLLIVIFVVFNACSDKITHDSSNHEKAAYPQINVTTRAELIGYRDGNSLAKELPDESMLKLAYYLASSQEWLKKSSLQETKEYGVPIAQLVDDASTSEVLLDNIEYTIKIEMTNLNKASVIEMESNYSYGVALDPDLFYPNKAVLPVYYWNADKKIIVEQEIPIVVPSDDEENEDALDASKVAIPYPLFLVTIERTHDDPAIEAEWNNLFAQRRALCTENTVPYFVVKRINLFDKKDWGNDEFEMYVGESIINNVRTYKTTKHKFNGNSRKDARNDSSYYYRDVNGKQGWEIMPRDIAIWPLVWAEPNAYMRIVDVEDDWDAGIFEKIKDLSGGTWTLSRNIKHYRVTSKTVLTSSWDMEANNLRLFDQDEVYGQSGIDQINEVTVRDNLGADIYLNDYIKLEGRVLNDINYWVGVRRY